MKTSPGRKQRRRTLRLLNQQLSHEKKKLQYALVRRFRESEKADEDAKKLVIAQDALKSVEAEKKQRRSGPRNIES